MCSTLVDERLDSKIHGGYGSGRHFRALAQESGPPEDAARYPASSAPNVRISCAARARDTPEEPLAVPARPAGSRSQGLELPNGGREPSRSHRRGAGHQARPGRCNLFGMSGLGRFLTLPTCSTLVDGRPDSKIRDRRGGAVWRRP